MRRLTLALILITALVLGLTPAQASSYSQIILLSAPERYYRLDETSGIVATDSAHGWNGTYTSATLNQSGAIYDGNAAITLPSGAFVSLPVWSPRSKSYAFEFWFNAASGATNSTTRYLVYIFGTQTLVFYVNYTTAGGYILAYSHGSVTFTVTGITADTWYYVVLQYNYVTSRVELYLNGTLNYSTAELNYAAGAQNLRMGDASSALVAKQDEFALYDGRVLSQDEITLHYNTGFAAYNTPTPTVTDTPTITLTPSNTPTFTVTPSMTPGWDYEIPLPSGRTAAVRMEATAGDVTIIMLLVFAVAILLLTIYLRRRDVGSK